MVIVLEDDIYVSDSMYHYAYQAVEFYGDDENIAGISLYTFQKNWLKWLARFEPQKADFDAFFMKIAMSWGQVWTYSKWKPFKEWLSRNEKFTKSDKIPYALNQWPETSEQVKTDYVFITLDDYYLIKKVQDKSIGSLLKMMVKEKIDYVRLFLRSKRSILDELEGYKGIYNLNTRCVYSVNLYSGLWKKDFILDMIKEVEEQNVIIDIIHRCFN